MTVVTLATIPACIAVVTISKNLGLPARLAPVMSIITGIVLSCFDLFIQVTDHNHAPTWASAVGAGFILGLSASGLYDSAKLVGTANSVPRGTE